MNYFAPKQQRTCEGPQTLMWIREKGILFHLLLKGQEIWWFFYSSQISHWNLERPKLTHNLEYKIFKEKNLAALVFMY